MEPTERPRLATASMLELAAALARPVTAALRAEPPADDARTVGALLLGQEPSRGRIEAKVACRPQAERRGALERAILAAINAAEAADPSMSPDQLVRFVGTRLRGDPALRLSGGGAGASSDKSKVAAAVAGASVDEIRDALSCLSADEREKLSGALATAEELTLSLLEGLLSAAPGPEPLPPRPVLTHDKRLGSGERGLSLGALAGVRRFYEKHGALEKGMGAVCKEVGFGASVCALTRRSGLALAETLVREAERRGLDPSPIVGRATSFFSYSWTGTRLGDMLGAIKRLVADLEAAEAKGGGGAPQPQQRFVWLDMFSASQNLLAGVYKDPSIDNQASEAYLATKVAPPRPPLFVMC